MARNDDTKMRLEELDNLKAHLRGFNGQRLAAMKGHTRGDDQTTADADAEPDEVSADHASHAAESGDTDGHHGTVEHDGESGEDFGEGEGEADEAAAADCPGCGEHGAAGAAFCSHCGTSMAQDEGGESEGSSDAERLKALAGG